MSEREPILRVYHHPNPDFRSFLLEEEIAPPRVERFQVPMDREQGLRARGLGPDGERAVLEIMALPGVHEVRIKPLELRVRKASDASWEALTPRISHSVLSLLKRRRIRVVK